MENEQPRGADTEKFPILVLMQKSHGCLCITLSDSLLFGGSHAFQQLFILQQWQRWLVVSLESGWVSLGRSRLIFLRVRISRWQRRAEITPGALSLWPHVNRVRVYPEFDAIICRRRRSATRTLVDVCAKQTQHRSFLHSCVMKKTILYPVNLCRRSD